MVNATLYGDVNSFRTQKVLVAAKVAGKNVDVKSNVPADKFPLGLTPAYEEGETLLFGADAIVKHIAKEQAMYVPASAALDQWLWWADSELLPNVLALVLPSLSYAHVEADALEQARRELHAQLQQFDRVLIARTFLVGERLSAADVSVALNLVAAYRHVLDTKARNQLPNLTRWFTTVTAHADVRAIVGEVTLAEEAAQFSADAYKKNASKTDDKKVDDKKKADKPHEKKEKAPKPAKAEEEDEGVPAEPKFVDPLGQFPAGNFNMDAFKRVYSNEDTEKVAIPYFWQKFEPEFYSIWYCEYKYPEDLALVFMSCNLITGMFQRLDKMRKHAFGSVALFGENSNSQIAGIWVWRGHELVFPLSPDWQVDYESYAWKKLDPKDDATKTLVNGYLTWEGIEHNGKAFNQGKIFK